MTEESSIGAWLAWLILEPFSELIHTLAHRGAVAARCLSEILKMKLVELLMRAGAPEVLVEWVAADGTERAVRYTAWLLNGPVARFLGTISLAKLLGFQQRSHEDVHELRLARRTNAANRLVSIHCVVQRVPGRQRESLFPDEPDLRVTFSVENAPADPKKPGGIVRGTTTSDPAAALLCYYAEGETLDLCATTGEAA